MEVVPVASATVEWRAGSRDLFWDPFSHLNSAAAMSFSGPRAECKYSDPIIC